jgi:hypothetical protein
MIQTRQGMPTEMRKLGQNGRSDSDLLTNLEVRESGRWLTRMPVSAGLRRELTVSSRDSLPWLTACDTYVARARVCRPLRKVLPRLGPEVKMEGAGHGC